MLLERLSYPEDFPIHITVAGVVEDPIHYHTDIEFVYVLRGSIQLTSGYCRYELHAGDVFTNSGNEVHCLRALSGDNVVARIHISTADFSQYFPNLHKACYRTYSKKGGDKRYARLKELMLQLLMKYQLRELNYKSECVYLMVDILKHLNRYFNLFAFDKDVVVGFDAGNQLASDRISRICQHIYQNYADNITLQDLSEMEYLSPFYLSHLIKDFTGMNFREFLCFARVEMSEIRLLGSDMKISQIARDVGFSTTAYYNKYFTRWFGHTPQEHRTQYRSQVKSDLKPAVYQPLPPHQAIAVVRQAYSSYSAAQEIGSVVTGLSMDVNVDAEGEALRPFAQPVRLMLTCRDAQALGLRLFSILRELSPAALLLLREPDTDEDAFQALHRQLTEAGFAVETGDAGPDRGPVSYAFDSVIYPLRLLTRETEPGTDDFYLRDTDSRPSRILQGQSALLTAGGVKKPAYFAAYLLSRLRGELIARGNQYCVIRCREGALPCYVVLAFNCSDAVCQTCCREAGLMEVRSTINDFRDELSLGVNLDLRPGTYAVVKYQLSRENNIFSYLSALDFQEQALPEGSAADLLSCWPTLETYMENVRSVCSLNFLLKGIGLQAAVIRPMTESE